LTTLAGDRWDTPRHPLRAGPNWHDVQVRIEGEAVADVEHNFRQRWTATTGRDDLPHRDPAYDPAWQTPVQIARTIPRHVYPFAPRGEYGIHHAYINALRGAKRFVYLENQYLWCPDIMDALIAAMNREMETSFPRIAIVLPARATSGKWDNDQHVTKLREIDNGRGMISVYSLYTSGPNAGARPFTYRPIYLHAKVAIIDDEWLTVGSANLNNRGLVTDSEINAVVRDAALARDLRIDLWAEHLALPREQVRGGRPHRPHRPPLARPRRGERAHHRARGSPADLADPPLQRRPHARLLAAGRDRGAHLRTLTGERSTPTPRRAAS